MSKKNVDKNNKEKDNVNENGSEEAIDHHKESKDPEKETTHRSFLSHFLKILILSGIFGAICGFVMVGFNVLLLLFEFSFSFLPYFINPIIAGIMTSLLVRFGRKWNLSRIMGSGAPEFVEEVTQDGVRYSKLPILIGKTFATSWTFGSGMACGKEGPGLLIGANLGHLFEKRFNFSDLERVDFYFVGASACTSAILKIPISGALFCAELPYTSHIKYRSLLPSIFASAISYIIFCSFFEFTPLISATYPRMVYLNYPIILPLTIVFGLFIGGFVLLLVVIMRGIVNKTSNYFKKKNFYWIVPLIGALFYSIFLLLIIPYLNPIYHNIFIAPDTFYLSYIITHIRKFDWFAFLLFIFLFLIAMSFSIGFSNSAGLILPLMVFGALVGGFFGVVFYPEHPELFVLIGISAALGAALKNPITAIIIIVEMTWEPFLFIPAGIATIIAYICSGPNSIIPGEVKKPYAIIRPF